MKKFINWFFIRPRYIDNKKVDNQWYWLGAWIVFEPDTGDDPCPTYEVIYSNWRFLLGYYREEYFWQLLLKFYPYVIRSRSTHE